MSKIEFHSIELSDKAWMDARFAEDDRNACEYTFANNYVWKDAYRIEVAESHGCAIGKFVHRGVPYFSYPIGSGDKQAVIADLIAECALDNKDLQMLPVTSNDRRDLRSWFPGRFFTDAIRYDFDYVYSSEKLATLAGRKLHGKRNHIAAFNALGDWSYEKINNGNLDECRKMTAEWKAEHSEEWSSEMEDELHALALAFDNMKFLNLAGGLIRLNGRIAALSVGERLNSNTFVVHFEKALFDFPGAYTVINQQFVQHECAGFEYVNREEDTGDPGLRRSKLSYYPEILLAKYQAMTSDAVNADPVTDSEKIRDIWRVCFHDDDSIIDYFLQNRMTENNLLTIYRDGRPVSMAAFLPVQYRTADGYIPARYIYAVATLPEYRGRGLAAELINFAASQWPEPMILSPAGPSLYDFYAGLGFHTAFHGSERLISSAAENVCRQYEDPEGNISFTAAAPEEYAAMRDSFFEAPGYVCWDTDAIRFAIDYNAVCGGKALIMNWEDGRKSLIMYCIEKDRLVVIETTEADEKCLKRAVCLLMRQEGVGTAVLRIPGGMIRMPDENAQGSDISDGYLNLTLE